VSSADAKSGRAVRRFRALRAPGKTHKCCPGAPHLLVRGCLHTARSLIRTLLMLTCVSSRNVRTYTCHVLHLPRHDRPLKQRDSFRKIATRRIAPPPLPGVAATRLVDGHAGHATAGEDSVEHGSLGCSAPLIAVPPMQPRRNQRKPPMPFLKHPSPLTWLWAELASE